MENLLAVGRDEGAARCGGRDAFPLQLRAIGGRTYDVPAAVIALYRRPLLLILIVLIKLAVCSLGGGSSSSGGGSEVSVFYFTRVTAVAEDRFIIFRIVFFSNNNIRAINIIIMAVTEAVAVTVAETKTMTMAVAVAVTEAVTVAQTKTMTEAVTVAMVAALRCCARTYSAHLVKQLF